MTWSMIVVGLLILGMSAAIVSLSLARGYCGNSKSKRILSYRGITAPASAIINYMREVDMKNMNSAVYMNFAKRNVVLDSQITTAEAFLTTNLLSNPHSSSGSSNLTRENIAQLRKGLLKTVLSTSRKRYTLIFTDSVASSWKLLGESFPWTNTSTFWYNQSTSAEVLGIRKTAGFHNARFMAINSSILSIVPTIPDDEVIETRMKQVPVNFMVLPLVNAFDGARTPRKVMRAVTKAASVELLVDKEVCFVAADASISAGSTNLNLTDTPFHAVVLSFEELFGMPEISALVIRNDALDFLKKRYNGGGTLVYALVDQPYEVTVTGPEAWEDGTIQYQQIASLNAGLDLFEVFAKSAKEKRLFELTQRLYNNLKAIQSNRITFYGNHELKSCDQQAPILTFRVSGIESRDLVERARQAGFIVHPVCRESLKRCLEASDVSEHDFQHGFNASLPFSEQVFNGKHLEAVRVSLGWTSVESDVDRFSQWLATTIKTA